MEFLERKTVFFFVNSMNVSMNSYSTPERNFYPETMNQWTSSSCLATTMSLSEIELKIDHIKLLLLDLVSKS